MERCLIVDYGFLQSQPSHSLQGNSKRVPSKPQSHRYLRKVLSRSCGCNPGEGTGLTTCGVKSLRAQFERFEWRRQRLRHDCRLMMPKTAS